MRESIHTTGAQEGAIIGGYRKRNLGLQLELHGTVDKGEKGNIPVQFEIFSPGNNPEFVDVLRSHMGQNVSVKVLMEVKDFRSLFHCNAFKLLK